MLGTATLQSAAVFSATHYTGKMAPVAGKKAKKGILERLNAGEVVIGDGGFVFALEKRGYVKAGPWTPEAAVEHPEAVRQLHREFLRAGSNVMQTFTFYASEDKLENRGNYVAEKISGQKVNEAACDIARQVADEGDALVAGGVSQTPSYLSCKSEVEVKKIFRQQLEVFMKKNVDFLIAEVSKGNPFRKKETFLTLRRPEQDAVQTSTRSDNIYLTFQIFFHLRPLQPLTQFT